MVQTTVTSSNNPQSKDELPEAGSQTIKKSCNTFKCLLFYIKGNVLEESGQNLQFRRSMVDVLCKDLEQTFEWELTEPATFLDTHNLGSQLQTSFT